jgi:hypothetical protein
LSLVWFPAYIASKGNAVLILKLTIVPLALLALGIIERLHGPRVAGWLSGFPVVASTARPLVVPRRWAPGSGWCRGWPSP